MREREISSPFVNQEDPLQKSDDVMRNEDPCREFVRLRWEKVGDFYKKFSIHDTSKYKTTVSSMSFIKK